MARIRRSAACALTVLALTFTSGFGPGQAVAWAQSTQLPPANEHNCAGDATSFTAQLFGRILGVLISATAQLGLVDNVGLASCGDNPRQNP
jgi:hypothetical protein